MSARPLRSFWGDSKKANERYAMKDFSRSFKVNAPLKQVAEFHSDSRALKTLTPPITHIQLQNIEPLGEGSIADFVIWLGPIPVHWKAKHSDVDPMHGFTDTQIEGPFKYWQHRHSFISIGEGRTEVKDVIQARFSRHPYQKMICILMWSNLPVLFAYRAMKTRQELEG